MGAHYVSFDIESTGLDIAKDRIIDIAFIELDQDLNEMRRFHTLVNPDVKIPEAAIAVHGITDEMVADAPKFKDIAARIQVLIGNRRLMAYNNRYDIPMLDRQLREAGQPGIPEEQYKDSVDVLLIEKVVNSHKLSENYRRRTGQDLDEAHHSLADTEATVAVARDQVLKDLKKLGVSSLDEVNMDMLRDLIDPVPAGMEYLDSDRMFCRTDADRTIRFARGKNRGKPCEAEPGMLKWMLQKDFAHDTKKIAGEIYEQCV